MPGTNHDWLDLDHYLAIHQRCMERAESYIVDDHDIAWPVPLSSTRLRFEGVVHCKDGIELHVNKVLERDATNRVRGASYAYHAQVGGSPPRNLFRYDNARHFPHHPDPFHKHIFDGVGEERVEHIGRQDFPTLMMVLDEVFEWWNAWQR